MNETQRNELVAQRICRDLTWNGQTFRLGDYVALLDGHVVAVTDNSAGALRALRSIDPDPRRGMVVEVSPPLIDVIR